MSASTYAAVQAGLESPRETELRAFRYVNGLLASATAGPARSVALHKVHRLWAILLNDLAGGQNALPEELKARLISLGLWAQREAMARLDDEASVAPLLSLHRDMIEALEAQRAAAPSGPVSLGVVSA
jgi:flagellar protein FlaF